MGNDLDLYLLKLQCKSWFCFEISPELHNRDICPIYKILKDLVFWL